MVQTALHLMAECPSDHAFRLYIVPGKFLHVGNEKIGAEVHLFVSPEVQPTGMRDYSLYVLDPLEDIMSRNARGSSDGVAVGMGLLSSVMSSEESNSAMVTGTVIQCAPNELALEVVISLRQVCNADNASISRLTILADRNAAHRTVLSQPSTILWRNALQSTRSLPPIYGDAWLGYTRQ